MNFKKFDTSDNQWHDIPYYQHKTATDTLTPPATLYPNDTSITVGIKGNTAQSGTPSSQNPVDVNGVGERTGNLFDITTVEKGRIDNGNVGYASAVTNLTITGNKIEFTTDAKFRGVCGGFIEIPNGVESISFYGTFRGGSGIGKKFVFYDAQKSWLNADAVFGITDNGGTATIPSGAKFVRMSYTAQEPGTASISNFMLNLGSTPLPYEPYGYKIPISMGGTTNNVYLGEVQTVRQIKKLVLTGQEAIDTVNVNGVDLFRVPIDYTRDKIQEAANLSMMCNAYPIATNRGTCASTNNTMSTFNTTNDLRIVIHNDTYTTADDFKAYLQQLYSANTPVIVWYILATPQTAVVNEPLQKIGNYADSLTTTVSCTAGENTLDVQTTVQPSEITANYKGWHPKTPKVSNNGQWS